MAYKKILFRRDTLANWASTNPVLSAGEIGLESDTSKIKLGNGSSHWNVLDYFYGSLDTTGLDALADVVITSAQNGDFLRWNGAAWINDAVNLSTDTVGSYVTSLVAGTGVTLSNNSGEGATPTVAIGQAVATSSSVQFAAVTAPVIGNASTASTLQTARTIQVSGDVSGSATFDGSQNINITSTIQPNSVTLGTDTTGDYVTSLVAGTGVTLSNNSGESASPTIAIGQAVATSSSVTFAHVLGDVTGNLTGNASTASAFQTSRTISLTGDVAGSVSFNGSGDASITTAVQPNSVALGTDTTGNYMKEVTGGTGITISHTPGEGSNATISIGQPVETNDSPTFAGLTADAVRIGVTNANTIDTASGGLTLNSSSGTTTIDDDLIITGALTVSGSVAYVNTTNLQVGDNIITLNNDETGTPSQNAGIEIERGTSTNVVLQYNETNDKWELTNDGSSYSSIETTATVNTSLNQQLWISTVYAATTTALSNSPSYTVGTSDVNGGTGIGAKLSATTNGLLQIDGAPAPLDNRILVKNQANALHNGIYKVTATGSASAKWELTRSTEFDNSTSGQVGYGKSVRIATGDVNALQAFAVTSYGSVALNGLDSIIHVIGTDGITWSQVSGKATLIPGNGLDITNNTLSLPSIIQSNTASVAGSSNFVETVNTDGYGRVIGVKTNNVVIPLGSNTTGDYAQSVSASVGTGITVSGTGAGATVSVGSNATPNNTNSTIVMRDSSGNFSAGVVTAALTGNASTANTLYAARSIGLTGDLSGSVSFNGSQDVVINATVQSNSIALGADTTGNYVASLVAGTGLTLSNNSGEGSTPTVAVDTTAIQTRVTGVSDAEIGYLDGVTSGIQSQIDGKLASSTASSTYAPIASPTFTGTPTLPTGTIATTQTASDSTTKVATTQFVTTADNLKADIASPTFTGTPTLPTGTIAVTQTALDSSTKVATTAFVTTADNLKADIASPTFTGTPTLPTGTIATTQTAADSSTKLATTAFVTTADNLKANLASPTFTGTVTIPAGASISGFAPLASPALTGTPTAPTAAASTNTTQVATTAFVRAEVAALVGSAGATLDTLGEIATALGNDANLSTTLTTSIGLKAPLASPTFTGTVTIPTGASVTLPTIASGINHSGSTSGTTKLQASAVASGTITLPAVTGTVVTTGDTGTVTSTMLLDGTILNADINASAAIDKTKISGTAITAGDTGTVTSAMILDATIVNADISTTAAIDLGKLADVSTSAQTASYTLILADKNKIVEMSNASANILTVPPNSSVAFPVGSQINVLQTGAGQTTVTAGVGVTINGTPGLKMRTQWSYATLVKRATDTWVLVGDISA